MSRSRFFPTFSVSPPPEFYDRESGTRSQFVPAGSGALWLLRREVWGGFLFDPFPGGAVYRLSPGDVETIDYLLSGGLEGSIASYSFLRVARSFFDLPHDVYKRLLALAPLAQGEHDALPEKPASRPLKTAFLVTDECPRRCPWCCVQTSPPGGGLSRGGLVFPTAHELETLADPGGAGFHLHGGEPLLCDALPDFVAMLTELGFVASLSTHAVPPRSYWNEISEAGLELLQLSWEPGKDAFPHFVRNLQSAASSGLNVVVNVVMTSTALRNTAVHMLETLLREGAIEVRFSRLLSSLSNPSAVSFKPSQDEVEALRKRSASFSEKVHIETGTTAYSAVCRPDPVVLCAAADGFIYPCDRTAFSELYRLADWSIDGLLAGWHKASCFRRAFPCPLADSKNIP